MPASSPMTVYLDTSVLGGYFDPEFMGETRSLFRLIRTATIVPVVSQMVLAEVARAPLPVHGILDELLALGAETLTANAEAIDLQDAYLSAGVIGPRWVDDAMHVALASIGRVDALLSWNFKHLVDPRRTRGFSAVNLAMGYGVIEIRSPGEIVRALESER